MGLVIMFSKSKYKALSRVVDAYDLGTMQDKYTLGKVESGHDLGTVHDKYTLGKVKGG